MIRRVLFIPSSLRNNTRRLCFSSSSSVSAVVVPQQPWLETTKNIDDTTDINFYKYFQNGEFVSSAAGGGGGGGEELLASAHNVAYTVKNPATQEIIGHVPELTSDEFNCAVALAENAFQEWKLVPVSQRQRIMLEYQKLIRDNTDDLAYLISLENGKTLADAKGDIFRGLEMVESATFLAPQLQGDSLQGIGTDMDCISYREPLGVCAGKHLEVIV
jgi:acyl-CoA reductase-like NAD-dependent aldehyde dehydrogenase